MKLNHQSKAGGKFQSQTTPKTSFYEENDFHKDLIHQFQVLKRSHNQFARLSKEYAETERRYSLLFEHLSLGFALCRIICDENNQPIDSEFVTINPAFEKVVGLSKNQIVGKRALDVMPGTEKYLMEIFGTVAITSEPCKFEYFSSVYQRFFQVSVFCPEVGFFAAYFNDLTDSYESKVELQRAKLKAEESKRLRMAFLENMSHELRTPMNAIVGFSELMSKPGLPLDKIQSYAEHIHNGCFKLIELITDVIEMSQIQAGSIQFQSAYFDLNELLNEVYYKFSQKASLKNIDLWLNLNFEEKTKLISTDRFKLERILSHLVDNAIKFTEVGSVKIHYTIENKKLSISISDTGIGIAEEFQSIIFEPFQQVDNSISKSNGGTGLGLSIVKSYIKMLGGEYQLESKPMKGTTFTLHIPIHIK